MSNESLADRLEEPCPQTNDTEPVQAWQVRRQKAIEEAAAALRAAEQERDELRQHCEIKDTRISNHHQRIVELQQERNELKAELERAKTYLSANQKQRFWEAKP